MVRTFSAGYSMLQYLHMKLWRTLFLSLFALALVMPGLVLANDCECWCESSSGAYEEEGPTTVEGCRDVCDDYLGCFIHEDFNPENSSTCWTEYGCENTFREVNGEEVPYSWAGQSSKCVSGEGECYAPTEPVSLNVAIGTLEEVSTLPDYINAGYNYLLPVAALLAVVVMMIGGLQWMLARGDAGRIQKAKDRLRNATTGLVLLMLAVVMAQFVDPRLVELRYLSPPAIKTVVFIDPSSTCEALEDAGMTITPPADGGQDCGDTGTVADVGETDSTWSVGDECPYTGCSSDLEVCTVSTSSESGYACARCKDVYNSLTDSEDLEPSSSICSRLLNTDYQSELSSDQKIYCEYYDAPVVDTEFNSCVEIVYPADRNYLDCFQLRQDAAEDGNEGCRAYDLVQALYEGDYDNELDDKEGADEDWPLLAAICQPNDPCDLAPPGETCELFIAQEFADCEPLDGAEYAACIALLPLSDDTGLLATELVNCSNSSSILGWEDCVDVHGEPADCNITW